MGLYDGGAHGRLLGGSDAFVRCPWATPRTSPYDTDARTPGRNGCAVNSGAHEGVGAMRRSARIEGCRAAVKRSDDHQAVDDSHFDSML